MIANHRIANHRVRGLDMLAIIADAAAERACAQLTGTIRLAKCEGLQINEGFEPGDVDLESWSVAADRQTVVISVFATAIRDDGDAQIAGTGRFTFTTLTGKRKYRT